MQVNENHVRFIAQGVGARGSQLYEFELELFGNIVPVVNLFLSLEFLIISYIHSN